MIGTKCSMDEWAEHREEIEARIVEGYAAAKRGELIEAEQVRSRLDELRRARLNPNPKPNSPRNRFLCKEL